MNRSRFGKTDTLEMPDFWENMLKGYVKKTFYADTRRKSFVGKVEFTEGDYRFFAKGVRDLSTAFTQERSSLAQNYLNQKTLRSGYILYFLPVNALKVASLLEKIPLGSLVRGLTPTSTSNLSLKILDVGSGPGTGMLGTMLYLENNLPKLGKSGTIRLDWMLLDQNRLALQDAGALYDEALRQLKESLPGWTITSSLNTVSQNFFAGRVSKVLKGYARGSADLILGLNVLGELRPESRAMLVGDLTGNLLSDTGKILLMEPALRSTTRDLMELRDRILSEEMAHVFAPCLHEAECPMLRENPRDWCHTYLYWERPYWIEKIDHLVHIRKDYLKCSYMILGQHAGHEAKRETESHPWRVVSGPLNSKGKSERLLCGEGDTRLLRIVRLDKDYSEKNRAFDSVERGDIVELSQTPRVTRETVVRKIG